MESKKAKQPERKKINGWVRKDLWLEFRGIIARTDRNVTEGLETALEVFIRTEPQ